MIKTNKTPAFCPREQALSFLSCVNSLLLLVIPSLPRNPLTLCHSEPAEESPGKEPCRLPLGGKLRPAEMRGKPTKRLRFAHEGTSTLPYRKMRPRPRLLVPTLTYLSRTKFCASGKICSVAPLPTKGLPFVGSLNTQRPCFRVSSSCTLYEVFGNFAWRSAPPRKRVTQ